MLSDMKVLIIEDESNEAEKIKSALSDLKNDVKVDKILVENIDCFIVNKSNDMVKIKEEIIQKIKLENIDVLFIDLHLIKDVNDGLSLINGLVNHEEMIIKSIPKYIVTSDDNIRSMTLGKISMQYAYLIDKGENTTKDSYLGKFKRARMYETLPILVNMYRDVKKSLGIEVMLKTIKHKLDKIEINTSTIKERTYLIENMNQTMIKLIPLTISDEKQKEKLKNFIKEDMLNYLEIDKDNFFPKEEDRNKFVDEVSKQFDEMVKGGFKKDTWSLLKDGIKEIAKTQGIDNDNAGLCAVNLVYRGYSEVARITKGEA